MIYKIHESYFDYAFKNNLNVIAESNIGDSFLIQADSCPIDFIQQYADSDLELIQSEEPYVQATEEDNTGEPI